MTKISNQYQERAGQLAKAIDIAESIISKSILIDERTREHFIKWGREMKFMALNPEPPFNKIVSLKYIENDFFIYWNEAAGQDVEQFWKEVFANGLGFERKDTIRTVLKRKRIKDIHEYNSIVDNILVAEQIGQISKVQARELSELIGDFENKNANKEI